MMVAVVDDEDGMRELGKAVLEDAGFEVVTASSGPEFLDMFKTGKLNPKELDAVLLDVMMPTMTGIEVCQKMRENNATKDIPVALVTVMEYSKLSISDRIKKMGVLDYIRKPYENVYLIERVRDICSQRKR